MALVCSFLLGIPDSTTVQLAGTALRIGICLRIFHDDTAAPKLTLNVGVRWISRIRLLKPQQFVFFKTQIAPIRTTVTSKGSGN